MAHQLKSKNVLIPLQNAPLLNSLYLYLLRRYPINFTSKKGLIFPKKSDEVIKNRANGIKGSV
jgi:hypothetical protein